MTIIYLKTEFEAEIGKCFDITRDVDIHQLSTELTKERAIAGRTSGLCELGDKITWEARHFGVRQQMTVEITKLERPNFFEDKMIKGAFRSMRHEHRFEAKEGKTVMTDSFQYEVPFGILGQAFDGLVLKNYMTKFLMSRNRILKSILEKK